MFVRVRLFVTRAQSVHLTRHERTAAIAMYMYIFFHFCNEFAKLTSLGEYFYGDEERDQQLAHVLSDV